MPYNDPEKQRIRNKRYYQEHKEEIRMHNQLPKVKERRRTYKQTLGYKAYQIGYDLRHKEEKRVYTMKYNQAHRDERLANDKEYSQRPEVKIRKRVYRKGLQQNLKIEILSHYSNGTMKCACCGENRLSFLTIDHVNGDGNKHRRETGSGRKFYYWLIKNNFPAGFQVLCFNCNMGKSINGGVCPHQQEREAEDKKWYAEQVQTLEEMIR